jgi:hypothetical protein
MANNILLLQNNKYKKMKLLRLLLPFLSLGIILSACQKDYSAESGTAKGDIVKDAAGDCTGLVTGSFVKDVTLGLTSYADVQVNITQLGAYSIKSDTVNGYFFSATGYAAIEGLTTVRLIAIGKPIAVGVDIFNLKFDASTCAINVIVTATGGGGGGTAAVFTLNGSPTACAASTQTTNFFATLPTTAANTLTIFANVTTAGTYSINTGAAVNGLTFSRTGTLAVGTSVPIVLTASGTPAAAGATFAYALTTTTPASNCGFTLTVQAAPTPAVYTFSCGAETVQGTYQVGATMGASNTIMIPITVASGGSYSISAAANGVTFSASGVLPATPAAQTITLTASGASTSASSIFTLTGGGGANCAVTIPFTPASTNYIRARFGSATAALVTFNNNITASTGGSALDDLMIEGDATSGSGSIALQVSALLPPIVINTNYDVNQFLTGFIDLNCFHTNAAGITFEAVSNPVTPQLIRPFTIRYSSISTTRLVGIFSGNMEDINGNIVSIYGGEFDVTF